SQLLMKLFWFVGPLAFILLYFSLTGHLISTWDKGGKPNWLVTPIDLFVLGAAPWWIFLAVDFGVILYGFAFLNVNMTSPHGFYRGQLTSAYLLKLGDDLKTMEDDAQKLSELGQS